MKSGHRRTGWLGEEKEGEQDDAGKEEERGHGYIGRQEQKVTQGLDNAEKLVAWRARQAQLEGQGEAGGRGRRKE